MAEKHLTKSDSGEFEKNLIAEYRFFFLFANPDQRLIGRCYAWQKRSGDMQDFGDLSKFEWDDIQIIIYLWSRAMRKLFQMTHPNYEWLGNEFVDHKGHGHLHMTPRYAAPVTFAGETFVDHFSLTKGGRPHREPPPGEPAFEKRFLPSDTMQQLIKEIKAAL